MSVDLLTADVVSGRLVSFSKKMRDVMGGVLPG
jgi:hypothetical protein